MSKYIKLIISIVACEGIGLIGARFTMSSIETWYQTLQKPFFSPPNWVFALVWTLLYLMMGIATYLVWNKGIADKKVRIALLYFVIQLAFNFLWSYLFFGLRKPLLAFFDIALLWLAIVMTMSSFYKLSKPSLYLLLPYLLWVSFAALLNLSIIILNPGIL